MGYAIIEDKGQQAGRHEIKHSWFKRNNVNFNQMPLPVGDYILLTDSVADVISRKEKRGIPVKKMDFLGTYDICVDTKRDIQEVVGNICGKQHERFRDECILAQNNGIQLYVLVENKDNITNLEELEHWKNPRLKLCKWVTTPTGEKKRVPKHPYATSGKTLSKAMVTMEEKYGVKFLFCDPMNAGEEIIKILTKGE